MPAGAPGSADGLVQTYNFRLCLTNNASNRLPFAPPANYTPGAMEVYRRWFIVNAAAVSNVSLLSLFLVRDLGESKIDVNQGSLPGASDFPFLQAAYPLADWPTRAAIAASYEWWTRAVWEFLRTDAAVPPALRAQAAEWGLPADEFLETDHFPPQLYVRESVRMRGAVVLSQNDVYGSTVRASNASVGLSQWLIDIHAEDRVAVPPSLTGRGWEVSDGSGVNTAGKVWQLTEVPLGALTPRREETSNLLVPVCASFTHVAFATYRLEPQYAVFGQSAAVAGVLAARAGIAVQDVDVRALQAELVSQGQLLNASAPQPPGPEPGALSLAACVSPPAPASQLWEFDASDSSLRLASADTGPLCVSIWGYSNASGAAVVSAACHTDDRSKPRNQAFIVEPGASRSGAGSIRLRSVMSGLCIAAAAPGSLTNSSALVTLTCDDATAAWEPIATAPSSSQWVAAASSLCVTATE